MALTVKLINPNESLTDNFIVSECTRKLKENEGCVLLVPIGGVYGLICKWNDKAAKDKMYKLKKSRTFQLFMWDTQEMPACGVMFSKSARKLALKLCPGPITIVDKDGSGVAFCIPGGDSLIQRILEETDVPLAVISAGRDAVTVDKAVAKLYGVPDAAVNKGELVPDEKISTVVELFGESLYKILRKGAVSEEDIKAAIKGN
jgi:tRNA A37 threonylcarbamoyladenosine synthetase subunit TsaC/SUA5/YrdC